MWLTSTLRFLPVICSSFVLACIFCTGAVAKFAIQPTRQVPIVRLLKNLEIQRKECGLSPTDLALVDFKIGRLHAMAYALKTEEGATDAQAYPGTRFELPDFGHTPDHVQFQVTATKDSKKNVSAIGHLKLAVSYLEKAAHAAPTFLPAKLGLAWCLEQSGQKDRAIGLYRQVFKDAFESERGSRGGMYDWSIARETSEYLNKLLDPRKNAAEIADIKQKVGELDKLPRYVTPIVIPLVDGLTGEDLLRPGRITFDLDGTGPRRYSSWISRDVAWLVFDAEGSGQIDSGLKLVGSVSFWLFWNDGYEVLRALDDDHNGVLTGGELDNLGVWQDVNSNGVSEQGEVRRLCECGIEALSTHGNPDGPERMVSPQGMKMSSGRWRPTWDVILHSVR